MFMEWWHLLFVIFGAVCLLMMSGIPIAFAFLTVNWVYFFFLLEGFSSIDMFILSLLHSNYSFTLIAIPMFLLMGEILFRSGVALKAIDTLDLFIGKMPGRLCYLVSATGVLFASVSGSCMANTALFGSIFPPEMEKKGYHKSMIFGSILGVGGLAMLIPPSTVAVLYSSIAQISVGAVLLGGAVPGLVLATLYVIQILIRVKINPDLAPPYEIDRKISTNTKIKAFITDILPLAVVIFAVVGTIIIGIATPSEAAALGALAAMLIAFLNKKLNMQLIKESLTNSFKNTGTILIILAGTIGFGQMMAYSGIVSNLVQFATKFDVNPLFIVFIMQIIVIFLGCFMEVVPLAMITIPIFYPIIHALGLNPIWFAVLNLVNLQSATITPPFGMLLFIMKGVAPKGTTSMEIIRSVIPFVLCDICLMLLIIVFPGLVLWLPGILGRLV